MLENTNPFAISQPLELEQSLIPTDLNSYGLDYTNSHTDQAMSSEPVLEAFESAPLSVLNPSESLELLPTVSNVADGGSVQRQTASTLGVGAWDSLTGQSTVNSAASTASFSHFNSVAGTLRADRFRANLNAPLTVISGNGNIDYGYGFYDYLDLSNVSSWSVTNQDFQIFDPGNGARLFDRLTFTNGAQVLFEGLDGIQFADSWLDLSVDPADPEFGNQWNLHMMGVQNAWRFTQGSDDVLVGIQDSGLGYSPLTGFHADLDRTIFFENNISDELFRAIPDEQYGPKDISHGTGVQGIIAATANNGIGTSGINWNSSVFHIDVLDGNWGDMSLASATQAMINQARSQGQKLVINMSLGGGDLDPSFEAVVANNQNNALFVIASGNQGVGTISNPASLAQNYANVLAVGASWGLSNRHGWATNPGQRIDYGLGDWGSNYGQGLSVMGPSEVFTTQASSTPFGIAFGIDSDFNGTSAAAPNVAGVASLVWSANSNLTATQVKSILAETAYDLGVPGWDVEYGHGFVNADAAVRRALVMSGPSSAVSAMGSLSGADESASPVASNWSAIANVPYEDGINTAWDLHDVGETITDISVNSVRPASGTELADSMMPEMPVSTSSLEIVASAFEIAEDPFSDSPHFDRADSDDQFDLLTGELLPAAIAAV